jgi:hypothetical protein
MNNQKNKFLKATIFISFIILIGVAIFWKKPIIKIFLNEDNKLNEDYGGGKGSLRSVTRRASQRRSSLA